MTNYIEQFMEDNNLQPEERFKVDDYTFYFDDTFSLVYVDGYEANDGTLRALLSGEIKIEKLKKEPWKPKYGDSYYRVTTYGYVAMTVREDEKDDYYMAHNPVFETKEKAEDYKWFLDKVDEYKRPFKHGNGNCYFYYDHKNEKVCRDYDIYCSSQGTTYFGGLENIKNFLEEVGEDRIKKYWFNVWE